MWNMQNKYESEIEDEDLEGIDDEEEDEEEEEDVVEDPSDDDLEE